MMGFSGNLSATTSEARQSCRQRVNYSDGAGFYPGLTRIKGRRHRYRRFESVAEALRFAIEELPVALLLGSVLEVDEARFDSVQMQALYDADAYPLTRRTSG